MGKYIFINYAHEDREKVIAVIERLQADGMQVLHGNTGDEKIAESCFVLNLYTPAARTSKSYRRVMNSALKHEKEMIVINILPDGTVPDLEMQLEMFMRLFKYHYQAIEGNDSAGISGDVSGTSSDFPEEVPAAPSDFSGEEVHDIISEMTDEESSGTSTESAAEDIKADSETVSSGIPEMPDKDRLYEGGMAFLDEEGDHYDPSEAFNSLWQAANRGHVAAQYQLSMCYAKGIGVRISINEAARYLEMAAYGGHVQAQAELGYCYETDRKSVV